MLGTAQGQENIPETSGEPKSAAQRDLQSHNSRGPPGQDNAPVPLLSSQFSCWQGWVLTAPGGDRLRAAIPAGDLFIYGIYPMSLQPMELEQLPALPEAGEDADGQEQRCHGCGVATGVEHLHGDKMASLEGTAPAQ